jgi:hypothetical protein
VIEVLGLGSGETQDLAVLKALKNSVEQQTRVLIDAKTVVYNQEVFSETIITRSTVYINSYSVRKLTKVNDHWVAQVICQVNEHALVNDLFPKGTNTPTLVDGPLWGIRVAQFFGDRAYELQQTSQALTTSQNQLRMLELFMSDINFRNKYPIKVKSVKPIFRNGNFLLSANLDISRPASNLHPNFFKIGVNSLVMQARFINSKNEIVYKTDCLSYYPWKNVVFEGPKDSEILSQTRLLSIIWI